jgi:hypothetical protein
MWIQRAWSHGDPFVSPRLSASPEGPTDKWPSIGEHTEDVLRTELALDDETLAAHGDAGVIRLPGRADD